MGWRFILKIVYNREIYYDNCTCKVDERLIHGQVATVWTNTVGAQRIMVVNDAAVKDQLQIGALKWLSLQELNYPFYQNVKRLKNFSRQL